MPSPNDIKKGTVINRNGELWVVVDFQRVSPGKGGSFVRTKMKSLSSGKVKDENFKASEQLDFADVTNKKMQYIFSDGASFTFMDSRTFDQVEIGADIVSDDHVYLKEGLDVTVVTHAGKSIAINLPGKVDYMVTSTMDVTKGDTVSGTVLKDAELDNGLKVKVPAFIKQGETIRVNTSSGEYVERVN